MKRRIYTIDVFKLVFAYLIALSHDKTELPGISGLGVELFFIISGFFLAQKYLAKQKEGAGYTPLAYTRDHIRRLYPHYLFSLIVLFLYLLAEDIFSLLKGAPDAPAVKDLFYRLYALVPEALMLQNTGFFGGGINYPLWQVTQTVIAGYFIYALLYRFKKFSVEVLFPLFILLIYAYLSTGVDIWATDGFFYAPLLRAIAPMSLGVLVCFIAHSRFYDALKNRRLLFDAAGLLAPICLFCFRLYRNIHLISAAVLLLCCMDPSSLLNRLLNRRIFAQFGELSYAIYLNHAAVIYAMDNFAPRFCRLFGVCLPTWMQYVLFLLLLSGYSVATMLLIRRFCRRNRYGAPALGVDSAKDADRQE